MVEIIPPEIDPILWNWYRKDFIEANLMRLARYRVAVN
jgi:hypothetical protein